MTKIRNLRYVKEKSESNLQLPFFWLSDLRSDNIAARISEIFGLILGLYQELLPPTIRS